VSWATPLVKRGPWWQVCATVSAPAAQRVAELMERLFRSSAVQCTRPNDHRTEISVYVRRVAQGGTNALPAFKRELAALHLPGCATTPGRVRLRRVRPENWGESWKRHFRPLTFGPGLLVKPTWSRRRARTGQAVVVLDPGLSFGTGQHPTTAFCLEQLTAFRPTSGTASALDIGTGSGILAIAAAKLGYAPVEAFDLDAAAIRIARANARRNGVSRVVRVAKQDLTRLPTRPDRHYDVICANLTDDLLLAEAHRIVARLAPGGRLIVAGILRRQFPSIRRFYERLGFRLSWQQSKLGWRSAVLVLAAPAISAQSKGCPPTIERGLRRRV